MKPQLPNNPNDWPEPWRLLYREEADERRAIMTIDGVMDDDCQAITIAVGNIEQDIRARFAAAVARKAE